MLFCTVYCKASTHNIYIYLAVLYTGFSYNEVLLFLILKSLNCATCKLVAYYYQMNQQIKHIDLLKKNTVCNRPFLPCMFCFPISDHIMAPLRTVSFKCHPMHVHPELCVCIIHEKTKTNSLENIGKAKHIS